MQSLVVPVKKEILESTPTQEALILNYVKSGSDDTKLKLAWVDFQSAL